MGYSPCMGCEERKVGCHATCEKYADFCELRDIEKEARMRKSSRENSADSARVDAIRNWKKLIHGRKSGSGRKYDV